MINFSSNPLYSDLNTLRFIASNNEILLKALDKVDIEQLQDVIKKSNLVPKMVQVHGKHGIYWSIRNVNPDPKSKSSPSHSTKSPYDADDFLITRDQQITFPTIQQAKKPSEGVSSKWFPSKRLPQQKSSQTSSRSSVQKPFTLPDEDFSRKEKYLHDWGIGKSTPVTEIKYSGDVKNPFIMDNALDAQKFLGNVTNFNSQESSCIKDYIECSDLPYYANAFVRGFGHPDERRAFLPDELKDVKGFVETMDLAISKSKLDRPIKVYRKVLLHREMIDLLKKVQSSKDKTLVDEGYCSTTVVRQSLNEGSLVLDMENYMGSVVFNIAVPSGRGVGAWIAPLAPSKYADQNEFLLPRGTQFKILTDISNIDWENVEPGKTLEIDVQVVGRKHKSIDTYFQDSFKIDWDYE